MRISIKLLPILILSICAFHANAQTLPDIAKLKSIIDHGQRILTNQQTLIVEHQKTDKAQLDSAFVLYNQALTLSERIHLQVWQNEVLMFKGDWYICKRDTASFKACYKKVIDNYHGKGQFKQEAETWTRLGKVMFYKLMGDPRFASECFEHARTLYVQLNLKLDLANSIQDQAKLIMFDGYNAGWIDVEKEMRTALSLYKAAKYPRLYEISSLLGAYYWGKDDAPQAINYWIQAMKNAEEAGAANYTVYLYNRLSSVYLSMQDYAEALKYSKLALKGQITLDNYYMEMSSCVNLMIHIKPAKEILQFITDIVSKRPPVNDFQKIRLNLAYGLCYTELGKYDEAEKYLSQMFSSYKASLNGQPVNYSTAAWFKECYSTLGDFYLRNKQFEKARPYYEWLITHANLYFTAIFNGRMHAAMFSVDSAAGQYISAINHLQRSKKISDSVFTAKNANQVSELTIKYQAEKQQQAIKLLNIEKKAQHAELERMALQRTATKYQNEQQLQAANYKAGQQLQSIKLLNSDKRVQLAELERVNQQRNIVLGSAVMFLIIAGLAYNGYRVKQKSNQLLQRQQKEIDAKNTTLEMLVGEKDWLLKEVHHRVKNNLHSVICLLESQAAYLENDALKAIEESQHRIYTMSLIHQKLYQSEDVKTIDMALYIPELVQYLSDSFDVSGKIHFSLNIEPIALNPSQAIPLALIINEALTNAIKYAFPESQRGEIMISLADSGEQFKLELADNGVGMSEKAQNDTQDSLGIELMKGLAKEIGGYIVFENDGGVKISVVFEHDSLTNMDMLQPDYLTSTIAEEINL